MHDISKDGFLADGDSQQPDWLKKTEEKNSAPKQEKNMDDLMTQIDKLKKEVEEIKSQK